MGIFKAFNENYKAFLINIALMFLSRWWQKEEIFKNNSESTLEKFQFHSLIQRLHLI